METTADIKDKKLSRNDKHSEGIEESYGEVLDIQLKIDEFIENNTNNSCNSSYLSMNNSSFSSEHNVPKKIKDFKPM